MSDSAATWLVGAIAFGLLALIFGEILFRPDARLFSTFGDGLKNYFTPIWAMAHDSGWRFTGMNYPFGEHLTYTDAQPTVLFVLRFLERIGLPVDGRMVGWLNALMVLSLVPAAMLHFKLHRHYHVPRGLAIWTALVAAFLSPQLHRWHGHYALAYAWVVPLIWWLALRLQTLAGGASARQVRGWWAVPVLALAIAAVGFIHLYYLLIAVLLLGAYSLVLALGRRHDYALALRALAAAGIGFVAVYATIAFTDGIADRTAAPWGFTRYRAQFESVFLPVSSPFREVWAYFIRLARTEPEGWAYVGFPGLLLLIGLGLRMVLRLRKDRRQARRDRRTAPWRMALPGDLGVWMPAAALVLIFSMALPFRWGLEDLLGLIPPLKQFRSPGRMAWAFHAVWTTATAVFLHRIWRAGKMPGGRVAATGLLAMLLGIWTLEAYAQVRNARRGGFDVNLFRKERFAPALKDASRAPTDFQAILSLPFYHNGSEKIYVERGARPMAWGMLASAETGLPLINVMMSRTSLSQTLASASLVSRYGPLPGVLDRFDQKPVLLLAESGEYEPREIELIGMADTLWHEDDFTLLSLPVSAFGEGVELLQEAQPTDPGLLYHEDFEAEPTSSDPLWLRQARGSAKTDTSLPGLFGAAAYRAHGPWPLANVPLDLPTDSLGQPRPVSVTAWFWADPRIASTPDLGVAFLDAQGAVLDSVLLTAKNSTDVWDGWIQTRWETTPPQGTVRFRATATLKHIRVDELRVDLQ